MSIPSSYEKKSNSPPLCLLFCKDWKWCAPHADKMVRGRLDGGERVGLWRDRKKDRATDRETGGNGRGVTNREYIRGRKTGLLCYAQNDFHVSQIRRAFDVQKEARRKAHYILASSFTALLFISLNHSGL